MSEGSIMKPRRFYHCMSANGWYRKAMFFKKNWIKCMRDINKNRVDMRGRKKAKRFKCIQSPQRKQG